MESILNAIKKLLGIEPEYEHFDQELIMNINTALMVLTQLGVGPEEGFSITGKEDTWEDFIGDRKDLEMLKTYIYLKVRLMFDPPDTSYLIESIRKQAEEFEWRLNVYVENKEKVDENYGKY